MDREREPGQTFSYDQIGWIDFETRSPVDIEHGTYRYMGSADALICAFAIGDESADTVSVNDFSSPLKWSDLPDKVKRHHDRVTAGEAIWAAYHAAFDRAAWNYAVLDAPFMLPRHIIDVMAQATAAGLPAGLADAARMARTGRKAATGKALIELFCLGGGGTPQSHPAEWAQFRAYAAQDVEAMRGVFRSTLQLSMAEWREYWTSETINERGVGVDIDLARNAAELAAADRLRSGAEISALTGGQVRKVTEVKRLVGWLHKVLEPDDRKIMVRREAEVDEDTGELIKPQKDSLNRARLRLLTARLSNKANPKASEMAAQRALELRLYGGSTTPAKFSRMVNQAVDGTLMGSYTFNGAPQTGRFSSRGVQIHNLMRDALPYEMDALDSIAAGASLDQLARLGNDPAPVCRKLSMLVRPALVPTDGECFVWGDWSQIEARVLPWLAASPGAEKRLDIFRAVDADPSLPDLYVRSVASMMRLSVEEVTQELRQRGKVAELACGFGGGLGALQNMAAAYNMALDDDLGRQIVAQWREANPWAVDFWGAHKRGSPLLTDEDYGFRAPQSYGLWGAANRAIEAPGTEQHAGRIMYIFVPDYLGGSLLCQLPSGRFLTYRAAKWERVDEKDDDDVVVDSRWELTFARGYGRLTLWPGMLAENVTQATAADVLRETLMRLVTYYNFDVRAHTHDEVLVQCPEDEADSIARDLIEVMEEGFDWSEGLPLKAEPVIARWYSKCKGVYGL
jgi:DNA polymerase